MAQIAYPETIRVVCTSTAWSERFINVWHIIRPALAGAPATEDKDAIAQAFVGFYMPTPAAPQTSIAVLRPTECKITKVTVQSLSELPYAPPYEAFFAQPGQGPGCLPLDLAAVCSLRTDAATRRGRGRVFIGPLIPSSSEAVSSTTPPQLTGAAMGHLRGAVATLDQKLRAIPDYPCRLGVLSKLDAVCRPVTKVVVDANYDVIRGRSDSLAYNNAQSTVLPI